MQSLHLSPNRSPPSSSSPEPPHSDGPTKTVSLYRWAWTLEVFGTLIGVSNAAYTTFGDNLPTSLKDMVPALPMVMLPAVELVRIPLTRALYTKRPLARCLALIALGAVTYPTVENWTIGFDRVAQMRVKSVAAAESKLALAKADQASASLGSAEDLKRSSDKRAELRNSISLRDHQIDELRAEMQTARDAHQGNLDRIHSACQIVRGTCIVPRSREEDLRYASELNDLRNRMSAAEAERQTFLQGVDQLTKSDGAVADDLAGSKSRLSVRVADAERQLREAKDGNFIYRLAGEYFRTRVEDLTGAQIAAARWVFAVVCAIVISTAGTLAAIIHYSPDQAPGRRHFFREQVKKLLRARRAYFDRKRRSLPVSDQTMSDLVLIARKVAEGSQWRPGEPSGSTAADVEGGGATAPASSKSNQQMSRITRSAA